MARAEFEVRGLSAVENHSTLFGIFFFRGGKKSDQRKHMSDSDDESPSSVQTCLKAVTKQLAFKAAESSVEQAAMEKYTKLQNEGHSDGTLSYSECLALLGDLLVGKETYILIDAIHACDDPPDLLSKLKDVWDRFGTPEGCHACTSCSPVEAIRQYKSVSKIAPRSPQAAGGR